MAKRSELHNAQNKDLWKKQSTPFFIMEIPSHEHSQMGFTSKLNVMQNNELLAVTFKKRITVNLF